LFPPDIASHRIGRLFTIQGVEPLHPLGATTGPHAEVVQIIAEAATLPPMDHSRIRGGMQQNFRSEGDFWDFCVAVGRAADSHLCDLDATCHDARNQVVAHEIDSDQPSRTGKGL
jgi:hypothetical protein